ncbi:MAG: 3-phosphoshikimate 1-carboxyvinyltransferase, partial [Acidimicrobiaceae bacterium]|nr:3-phosphoshikimate 1-carboxyvinyltransferase [Acidimicrobiaceae bacterium]
VVRGGGLRGIDYAVPVASAQVKGAILLAGLAADGPTTVREATPTRAHTEEMLVAAGARVERSEGAVTVWPGPVKAGEVAVPGDPSQAAFWVVAATLVPGSDLLLPDIYVGPGRAGFLDVLQRMGADITVERRGAGSETADLRIRHAPLRATRVEGAEVPSLIDEIPVLAVAAAYANGVTTFADAEELKVKESDRIASVSAALRSVGASVEPQPDGLVVEGRAQPLPGGPVESVGDHRVAMSMAVAALAGRGPVPVEGWESVATSYPAFEQDLTRCVS